MTMPPRRNTPLHVPDKSPASPSPSARWGCYSTTSVEHTVCKGVHMVLEIAEFTIRSGQEDEFAVAYGRAAYLIRDTPGCLSMRMTRGIESPSRFVLLVEWENVTDHTEGFRGTASFRTWREELGPFFAETPRVEHAVDIGHGDSLPVAR